MTHYTFSRPLDFGVFQGSPKGRELFWSPGLGQMPLHLPSQQRHGVPRAANPFRKQASGRNKTMKPMISVDHDLKTP